MKKLLFVCILSLLATSVYSQSLFVGVVGGVFNNGQMEENYTPDPYYSFEYEPQDPRFTVGLSATVYLLQHIRMEVNITRASVANNTLEKVTSPQTGYGYVLESELNYGKPNYQVTVSPAYRFNLGDIHPYIGAEAGLALPASSSDKTGWLAAGRLGVDVAVTSNLNATASINVGQMGRVTATDRSTNFSYYRILLGLSYTVFEL